MIDRRPRVIVRCAGADDVVAAVNFARENELDLAVRGGGHSVPGFGTADDAVVVDLSGMRDVQVDPEQRTARAEGGATWGVFNDATHAHGLATTGGIISTTGVGGLTLGGGIGYLARGFGLSCDNLRLGRGRDRRRPDAGRQRGRERGPVLGASWRRRQLRRRHRRSSSGCTRSATIYGGPIFFELARRRRGAARSIASSSATRRRSSAGSRPGRSLRRSRSSPRSGTARPSWRSWPAGPGRSRRARRALKPLRDVAPVVAEHVGPMPYPALNSAFDALYPPGPPALLEGQLREGAHRRGDRRPPRARAQVPVVNSTVHIYPINGACHRVAPDATAFAYRDATFATVIAGMWPDPGRQRSQHPVGARLLRRHRAATRRRAATSTSCPATTRTGSRRTTRGTTTGWSRSSGSTTPTISST